MTPSAPKVKKGRAVMFSVAGMAIVGAAVAAGVYAWQQQRIDDANRKSASLSSQLVDAKKAVPATTPTSNTISYTSTVGKFTLTLPNTYAIIRESDSDAGGGANTSLGIGFKADTTGVADYSVTEYPTLTARPIRSSETFRGIVDEDLKDKYQPIKTIIKVDGTDAESYTYGGFAQPRSVYFTKNGMYYRLQTNDWKSQTGKLEPVISGFAFVK